MENKKLASFVVVLLIVTLSCNFLFPDSQSHIPDVNGIGQSAANLPVLDPESPLPSPGAAQLRTLLANEPGIVALINDVETAEQALLKVAVADLQVLLNSAINTQKFASMEPSPFGASTFTMPPSARQSAAGDVFLVSYGQPGAIQTADGGLSAASIIGLISSTFTDYFSLPTAMPIKSFSETEKAGNVISNMSMEIGKSEDGSSHFGLGLQSEGTENGVSVRTDFSSVIDGQRCPTAEGEVSFSIKARIGSEAGGTSTTQDLNTFVRATVNDDAEIASSTFDVIQGTTQVKNGRQVYIESGFTIKYGQGYTEPKASNTRINQKTDNITQDDMNNLEPKGWTAALELGKASLESAQNAWQSGRCTKIVAASPGTVQPGSTITIPVSVVSIFDGSNAPSKLKADLTGAESIDPTSLAKTPGTLSYTAPNENGKSATILLSATSRRGKAKLELSAGTSGKFSANGTWGPASLTGEIDTSENPFTLAVSGGCTGEMMFSGGSNAGEVSCEVTCGGILFNGAGSYKITYAGDGGEISGSCSSLANISGDSAEVDPLSVTLKLVP
jgi:hypothetical protein